MMKLPALRPAGGPVLAPQDAREIYAIAKTADATDARKQVKEATRWRAWLMPVTWFLLAINAYFAARAMFYFADMGGAAAVFGEGGRGERFLGATDRVFMTLSAAVLIFAAQVLAVRLALMTGLMRWMGWFLLALCAAFSIITSTLCIAIMMQGGVDAGVKSSDAYQLAKSQAVAAQERAAASADMVAPAQERVAQAETAYADWQTSVAAQFERGSGAFNARQKPDHPEHQAHLAAIDRARYDLEAARTGAAAAADAAPVALEGLRAAEEAGGGSAHAVVARMGGWFGASPEGFALGLSLFINVLMELVRLFLAFITGAATVTAIKAAQDDEQIEREAAAMAPPPALASPEPPALPQEAPPPAPLPIPMAQPRPRAMARSSAPDADTVTGPVAEHKPRRAKPKAPGTRRAASFEAALDRVRAAARAGRLKNTGQDAIGELTGASTPVARRIQEELEEEGVFVRSGSRLVIAEKA